MSSSESPSESVTSVSPTWQMSMSNRARMSRGTSPLATRSSPVARRGAGVVPMIDILSITTPRRAMASRRSVAEFLER